MVGVKPKIENSIDPMKITLLVAGSSAMLDIIRKLGPGGGGCPAEMVRKDLDKYHCEAFCGKELIGVFSLCKRGTILARRAKHISWEWNEEA